MKTGLLMSGLERQRAAMAGTRKGLDATSASDRKRPQSDYLAEGKLMPVIACVGQKGGVSKSTLSRALAVELARSGLSVHLADLDID